jgi:hypothetical protein
MERLRDQRPNLGRRASGLLVAYRCSPAGVAEAFVQSV